VKLVVEPDAVRLGLGHASSSLVDLLPAYPDLGLRTKASGAVVKARPLLLPARSGSEW
jgi:hypothetical protein